MELKPGYKHTEVGVIPEDWEVRRLIECCNKITDGTHDTPTPVSTGFPFLTAIHIKEDGIDYEGCLHLTKTDHDIIYARCNPQNGDVLMVNIGAGVATTATVTVDYEFSLKNVALLKPTKQRFSGDYLNYALINNKPKITQALSTGGAQPFLSLTQIGEIRIPTPPLPEQRAIATALSEVDGLIRAQEQLIAKKRDLKQAAMQQLLTAQHRLPGFSGEWVPTQLGTLGKCLRGVSYKPETDLFSHDNDRTIRLFRSNNVQENIVVTNDVQFVNRERCSDQQVMRYDDILVCMANGSKALVGKAGIFRINDSQAYTFGAFMACFRTRADVAHPWFIFSLFQTGRYRDYIANLLAGSSINNLRPSAVESLEFPIPPLPEQTAIAEVLSDMDEELAALETRLAKTRALKQGMMQSLLTGRIRLI
jgi:type I restriction enzyme, S subunit